MAISYPSDSITETLITQIQALGGTPTSYGLGELMRLLADLQGQGGGGGSGAAVVRTVSATVGENEVTIFKGGASQVLTLPTPSSHATNVVKNYGTGAVAVGPAVLGGFFGFIDVQQGDSVTLSYASPTWYPTGAMQHPAAPVRFVDDYGGDPTGVADSAPAIQAAINDTGTVQFSPGTYRLNSSLILGNANLWESTVRAGSTGTTLNLASSVTLNSQSQGATIAPSGFVFVYTASLVAEKVTYTSVTGSGATTQLLGCSPNMATLNPTTGAAIGQGAPSTINNVSLVGAGLPGTFAGGNSQAATTLSWGGGAGGTMLKMFGPCSGMLVKNLQFNCGTAGIGINDQASQGSRFENVQVLGATDVCWFFGGNSGAWGGAFNGLILGSTLCNTYENIGITVNGTHNFATGFWFNGSPVGAPTNDWGSGGPAFLDFSDIFIVMPDPGSGNTNLAYYFGFADDVTVRNLTFFAGASAGTNQWAEFDYTQAGGDPSGILFDNVTTYATKTLTFVTNPPTSSAEQPFGANTIRNVISGYLSTNSPTTGSGGPSPNLANPKQFNLRWDVVGGETFVLTRATANNYFTSGTPTQISATDPVDLFIEETTSVTWTAAMQNTVVSPTENQTIKSSANPGANSYSVIPVPAGWFVTITCGTMADLTVSAKTKSS